MSAAFTTPNPFSLDCNSFLAKNILLFTVADHARGFGLQPDEALDGLGGAAARAQFQRVAEVDEAENEGGRFEIGMPRQTRHASISSWLAALAVAPRGSSGMTCDLTLLRR